MPAVAGREEDDVSATRLHRWFNRAALASSVLLACTVALWLAGFCLYPDDHHLSVTRSFHVGVWSCFRGPTFGRLVFFNTNDGPCYGGIIALCDGHGNSCRPYQASGWEDSFGVFFIHLRFLKSGATLWTLDVSLLYPFTLFAILPFAWGWRRWRRKERDAH
jgi:hypothetical protein